MDIGANYVVTMILGLAVILAVGGFFFFLQKKSPEKTIGEIINDIFLRQKISVFVLTLILINISEGIWAASISPKGEVQINALARMMTHFSVSTVAIVCGIYWPASVRALLWAKKGVIGRLIPVTIVVLIGSIGLPYLNALLISGGLKETHHLGVMLNKSFILGFMRMSFAMQATVIALIAHYFLVLLDGLFILISDDKETNKNINQGLNQNINKRGKEENKNKVDDLKTNNIDFLLNRYNIKNPNDLKNWKDNLNKVIDGMNDKDQNKLAGRCSALVKKIKDWDASDEKKNMSEEEKKAKNRDFKRAIYELVKASVKGGHGFGMNLPSKKGN